MSIPVSQAYIEMMKKSVLESRIEMTISNGIDTITCVDKDIVKDSLSANWRSSNNKELSLGSCYATSFSVSAFRNMETDVEGNRLVLVPVLYFKVAGGEQEIPLGVFYCEEPVAYIRTTSYECLDAMTFFDTEVTTRFTGTPFNLLTYICSHCGVPFGNTSQQIASMINSGITYVIDPDEVQTHRDALSYISTVLGGYCIIGRDGKLYVRQHHTTPDRTLDRKRRTKSSFAGYKTEFAGVKCRFLAQQNYFPYESGSGEDGMYINLGDIPIVEGSEATKHAILDNIWSVIEQIEYSPCSIDMVGDPSIEAGDMITTKDRYGYDRNILLTSVTYKWRSTSSIVSEGGNPKYNKVSTAAKRARQRAEQQAEQNTVVTATYANGNPITLDESLTEITSLRFVTNKDLTAIFGAEIPVYSDGDGYVEISYTDGGIVGDVVKARVHPGYNLITLVNHLYYNANRVVLLQLKAKTEPLGSGNSPTVSIAQDAIRSYIFAQGIVTEAPWDGIISISETIEYVEARMSMYGLTDGVTVSLHEPVEQSLSDVVAGMVSELNVYGLSDTVSVSLEYGDQILRMGEGHRAGMGRMYARF